MGIHSPSSRSFNRLENILIIGNGGRENSLAWAIQKNELVKKVYLIPGNAGSERINKCQRIKIDIKNEKIKSGIFNAGFENLSILNIAKKIAKVIPRISETKSKILPVL